MRKFDGMTVIENLIVMAVAGVALFAWHTWQQSKVQT